MSFPTFFSIPFVRPLLYGTGMGGVFLGGQLMFTLGSQSIVEENGLIAEPLNQPSQEFKHFHTITEQAFRDSGFNGPIHVDFDGKTKLSMSALRYWDPDKNTPAVIVGFNKKILRHLSDQEIYAAAGHEAQHAINFHQNIALSGYITCAFGTYYCAKQATQAYMSKLMIQSFKKPLPIAVGALVAYGFTRYVFIQYIAPQLKKPLEFQADIASGNLLGTKEALISILSKFKVIEDQQTPSIVERLTNDHPSSATRIKLIENQMRNPEFNSSMHRFFQSERYHSSLRDWEKEKATSVSACSLNKN